VEIRNVIKGAFSNAEARFVSLGLVVALASTVVLFSHVKRTPFHGDESGWIAAGRYYTCLLGKGDFDWQKWDCKECGDWGSMNMHLGKFLIGIPLALDPQARSQAFSRYYDFGASLEQNRQQGLVPPPETLTCARNASAVFGVFCSILVFAIGCYAYNTFVGLLSAGLLLVNPIFVNYATRAMPDVHYNFFLLCLCLAVLFFVRASSRKNALTSSAICGVFAGLACAVKITGILLGSALFVVALATQQLWFVKRSWKENFSLLVLFGLPALMVIYGLNPYFWPSLPALRDPAAGQEFKSYASELAESKRLPRQIRIRYPHFGTITRPLEFPRQFQRWKYWMSYAATTPLNHWRGRNRLLMLNYRLFMQFLFPGEILLLAAGIVFVVGKRLPELSGFTDPGRLIPLQWFVVNYLFILTFMWLNWARYYLPTLVSIMPLAALGIYGTGRWLRGQWLSRESLNR